MLTCIHVMVAVGYIRMYLHTFLDLYSIKVCTSHGWQNWNTTGIGEASWLAVACVHWWVCSGSTVRPFVDQGVLSPPWSTPKTNLTGCQGSLTSYAACATWLQTPGIACWQTLVCGYSELFWCTIFCEDLLHQAAYLHGTNLAMQDVAHKRHLRIEICNPQPFIFIQWEEIILHDLPWAYGHESECERRVHSFQPEVLVYLMGFNVLLMSAFMLDSKYTLMCKAGPLLFPDGPFG